MTIERVYFVTGASRGIGEAVAAALVGPGAAVFGLSRGTSRKLEARAAAGGRVEQVPCDLARTGDLDSLLSELLRKLPLERCSLLALINNAGTLEPVGTAGTLDAESVGRHFAVNCVAPVVLTNAFLRETARLSAGRRVLNVSSGAARNLHPGWSVYCGGKAAIDQFTRVVALEQRSQPNPARLVAMAPGMVDTDMQALARAQTAERFAEVERFREHKASGALADPSDVARRIVGFLHADRFGETEVVALRDVAT